MLPCTIKRNLLRPTSIFNKSIPLLYKNRNNNYIINNSHRITTTINSISSITYIQNSKNNIHFLKHIPNYIIFPISRRHYSTKNANDTTTTSNTHHERQDELLKDYYLSRTTSLLSKIKINLKWFLKKSMKPFNSDDISAFISWVVVSNVLIILLWTTGFVSLILYLMNTVLAQEYVALKVGETITENNPNLQVIFENAIVPDWKGGKITFNNVFVSKRPQVNNAGAGVTGKKIKNTFSKGSQREAAERAKLALSEKQLLINENSFDKGNYAQYDLTIDQVNVSLNFSKWFSGKGIIDELEINGVRGVVDRTHVIWKEHDDPRNYLNVHKPGDFELDKFVMNDVLFTLYQPNGFRPFKVSIFNCELPRLRKHWFFYDLLNATAISGTYDNSLFTIHKKFTPDSGKKQHNYIYVDDPITIVTTMRVDNLNIDHLNAGIKGPFGWITRGQVDMVGNIRVVPISATGKIPVIVNPKEFLENLLLSSDYDHMKNNKMIIDFYLKLHNVEAQVPLLTSELSYINNALIRPIVGYINSRKATYIPINCRIVKNLDDFAGSWTIYDSLLMDNLSEKVYDSFAAYVVDDERRSLRVKRIGFWSLQLMLQLILMSLGALA